MAKTKKALTELKKNSEKQEKEKLKENMYKVLSQIFTPGQIKMLLHPKKLIAWSSEDIANAMSLRCVSPKAYRYLRNVMKIPLPGLSTLRRWANNIEISPGLIRPALDCIEIKGKIIPKHEKLVVLMFDEVYINNKISIDRQKELVVGPHKSSQCAMVRSLFSN